VRRSAAFALGSAGRHCRHGGARPSPQRPRRPRPAGSRHGRQRHRRHRPVHEGFRPDGAVGPGGQGVEKTPWPTPTPRVRRRCGLRSGGVQRAVRPVPCPRLREAMRDKASPAVRQNAAWALGRVGAAAAGTSRASPTCATGFADGNGPGPPGCGGALWRSWARAARRNRHFARPASPLLDLVKERRRTRVVRKNGAGGRLPTLSGPEHADRAPGPVSAPGEQGSGDGARSRLRRPLQNMNWRARPESRARAAQNSGRPRQQRSGAGGRGAGQRRPRGRAGRR